MNMNEFHFQVNIPNIDSDFTILDINIKVKTA